HALFGRGAPGGGWGADAPRRGRRARASAWPACTLPAVPASGTAESLPNTESGRFPPTGSAKLQFGPLTAPSKATPPHDGGRSDAVAPRADGGKFPSRTRNIHGRVGPVEVNPVSLRRDAALIPLGRG